MNTKVDADNNPIPQPDAAATPAPPVGNEKPENNLEDANNLPGFSDLLDEPKDDPEEADGPLEAKPAVSSPQPGEQPQTPAAPAAAPAPAAQPEVKPPEATPAAPVVQPPAVPRQTPVVPPVEQQPAAPAEAAPVAPAPIDLEALRQKTIDELIPQYSFTDEEKELLQTEPEKVLPKIAAQLQVSTYEAICRTIFAHLPTLVDRVNASRRETEQVENQFYDKWKGLKDPKFRDAIYQTGTLFRAQNPNATLEDAINRIGAMVAFQLQIPMEQAMGVAATAAAASGVTPAAQSAPAQSAPHQPAAPGAIGGPPPGQDINEWAAMAREFEELE